MTSSNLVYLFDTTLRDGAQTQGVDFTVADKAAIARELDLLGIDFIEGGWPGSNPKDKEFFTRARDLQLRHARLTAFGSTRFAKNSVEQDPNVRALLEAATPAVSIFGKSWDLHTQRAMNRLVGGSFVNPPGVVDACVDAGDVPARAYVDLAFVDRGIGKLGDVIEYLYAREIECAVIGVGHDLDALHRQVLHIR